MARRVVLVLHAVLLVAGLAFVVLAVALHDPDGGADIGAGLGLLWLVVLGSPWSWPLLALDDFSGTEWAVATAATALLNLALHAWWVRRRTRRAATAGSPVS